MISQIVTLVGVLVGALTSYLSVTVAERAKHRRSLATRWDERKLNAYVEYATCVKEVAAVAKHSRLVEEGSDAHKEFMAAMEDGERRRSARFETLVLLAALPAIEAAHNGRSRTTSLWRRCVVRLLSRTSLISVRGSGDVLPEPLAR
ncbi:hypothetical protein [Streptomyces roseochromogenus]|uniref:hypothetical protein n=1 Tax=Streptomyces roseochromogenus TaxID=285450 RepID=UPI000ACACEBC|nr:hypothetical protein [Streptomyces roseochromogenus]